MEDEQKKEKKSKDKIYKNEKDKSGKPFWFQVMVNGKRVTQRGYRTIGEAKKARAKLETELNEHEYLEPSRTTFGTYMKNWIDNRLNIEESTRSLYYSTLDVHINPKLGNIELSRLTPQKIEEFIKGMKDQGLADETVRRAFSLVNAGLNAAAKKDIVKSNVADKIEKPKIEKVERQIWSDTTVKNFLHKTRGKSRYWIAFYLAIMTGMRQGELLGLQWSDVDLENKIITVRRSLRKDTATFSKVKTDKSQRTIAISQSVVDALEFQKQVIQIEKQALGDDYNDHNLVIPSSKGTPARATKVLKIWSSLQKQYKPEHEPTITMHDLRHQHASLLLQQNTHIKVVSERLGHSTASFTMDKYSHLMPNMQEKAAQELDDLLEGV